MITDTLLKDFQKATVNHIYHALFAAEETERRSRILVADEVGLGKTIVAKGLIERALADFQARGQQFRVVYICSNQQIARQNLKKLNVTNEKEAFSSIERITLIPTVQEKGTGGLRLIALSPNTSFSLRSNGGIARERAMLYKILLKHPLFQRRSISLKQLFQLDVTDENWKGWINYDFFINKNFEKEFLYALDLDKTLLEEIQFHLDNRRYSDISLNRYLVGRIREALAKVSLKALKPDLIILDEFQRFKTLLEQDDSDPIVEIAQGLFRSSGSKILLLSATPYKMYTIREEEVESGHHYGEFLFLLKFLFNKEGEFESFQRDWEQYSNHLIGFSPEDLTRVKREKERVERQLKKVICRTERNSVSRDHNTMVCSDGNSSLEIAPVDLQCFLSGERVAQYFRNRGQHNNSLIEYCKSAPFPLSFMDGYKLGRLLEQEDGNGQELEALLSSRDNWAPYCAINRYQKIEFPNSRLRFLIRDSLEKGGSKLLWIPPSLPCYELSGAFEQQRGFSKTLVFSRWKMAPRAIATLVSYEAERLTVGAIKSEGEKAARYNKPSSLLRSRLVFKKEEQSLSLFNLIYPCIFLARLGLSGYSTRREARDNLAKAIEERIERLPLDRYISPENNRPDPKWYWVVPILLDKFDFGPELLTAYNNLKLDDLVKGDPNQLNYLKSIQEAHIQDEGGFEEWLMGKKLGQIPEDLPEVLAEQAMGSPAICMLRTLSSSDGPASLETCLFTAFYAANSFRKYFNTPENTAVISQNTSNREYWRKVLEYCADGCLQSVLDEYFHIVEESNGLWDASFEKKAEAFRNSLAEVLSLRSASLNIRIKGNKQEKLRTYYAAAFMDIRESEKTVQRKEHVQNAFNSPFRPFILATTSIGQEGLDFHYYARNIMHWNLPSNPVDFEQREGRINRYKSHAIRLNLAEKYARRLPESGKQNLWPALFALASHEEKLNRSDLVPYWHTDLDRSNGQCFPIVRQVPLLPYSRDAVKLKQILRALPLYRLALGQPNQEELVNFLLRHLSKEEVDRLREQVLMDLSPFGEGGGFLVRVLQTNSKN